MDMSIDDLENVIAHLKKVKNEMMNDSKKIYIVNAGNMNHGKSSLLNSILDSEEFKVADVRETSVSKSVKYNDNIYLVDTPGLGASLADDEEAKSVYQKANYIFYVHSVKIGELNSAEIQHLKQLSEIIGEEYFWGHVSLVLTFIDEYPNIENLDVIVRKIKSDLLNNFQISNLPIFYVSNSRFTKSKEVPDEKKKMMFLEKSGIPEIRNFIKSNLKQWSSENLQLQESKFEKMKKIPITAINQCKGSMVNMIDHEFELLNEFCQIAADVFDRLQSIHDQVSDLNAEKAKLKNKISFLRDKHDREKAEMDRKNLIY